MTICKQKERERIKCMAAFFELPNFHCTQLFHLISQVSLFEDSFQASGDGAGRCELPWDFAKNSSKGQQRRQFLLSKVLRLSWRQMKTRKGERQSVLFWVVCLHWLTKQTIASKHAAVVRPFSDNGLLTIQKLTFLSLTQNHTHKLACRRIRKYTYLLLLFLCTNTTSNPSIIILLSFQV